LKNTETDAWELQAINIAPFTAFDIKTGELSVFTSDKAKYGIYTIKWRIEIPSTLSGSSFVEEIFDLTVIN
jgi:hypothetical protein